MTDRPENWDRVEEVARTLHMAPGATMKLPDRAPVASPEGRALSELAALGHSSLRGTRLEVVGTLGEGGMGVVRLGRQLALGREVAVKELVPKLQGDESAVIKLLQEAWVAGSLEHPNIVPIYDIEVRGEGEPRIVMKRIQGSPWSELVRDEGAVRERFGEDDLLDWNLRVLMQVANAVRFAHDRGIVHLDLKPANVMLGEFGEVYLVDWGLGMTLGDGAGGRFPRARDNQEIIGTPSYLAPEMLSGDGSQLSERTDVYLLGSVLYEVLTGRPPHRGGSIIAILYQAATAPPELPDTIPEELRGICLRAMALDPARRFPTADAFVDAVRRFVQHRGSLELSDEAGRQLDALRAAIARGPAHDGQAHWDDAHRSFTEARFGFRQALSAWEGNAAARQGLREAILAMGEHVLGHGSASSAASIVSELEDVPPELRARLDAALARDAAEADRVRRLERIGDDMDLSIGRRTRLFVMGILGLLWIAYPVVRALWGTRLTLGERFVAPAIFLAVVAGLGWYARESLGRTLVNRRLFAAVVAMFVAQIVLTVISWWFAVPDPLFAALLFFLWALVSAFAALLIEARLWPTVVGQCVGLATVTADHDLVLVAIVGANILFVVNILVIWWPGNVRGTYDGDARRR